MTNTELVAAIERQGYRLTAPRLRVLDSIADRDANFTAEEVCADVPKVGRATVFRTLKLLVERGLLCKMTLQDGSPRYSFPMSGHHHHLVCVSCGSVTEFRESEIEQLLSQLEVSKAGTIVGHRIEVYVVCPTCQVRYGGPVNAEHPISTHVSS